MNYENTAYGKFGAAISKKQIQKWNTLTLEMWILADFFVDRNSTSGHLDKALRLKDLIGQLPIFDEDGAGYRRSGNAIDEF